MDYAAEREREENLRAERRVMIDHLLVTKQEDPALVGLQERLGGIIRELRQIHLYRAMDPCSHSQCIEAGTVMETGKLWCPIHLPTRT